MPSPNPALRRSYSGNAVQTTLVSGIAADALTFELADATGHPTGSNGPFVEVIDPGTVSEEKILCDSRSGAVVTVNASGRGYDGSSATTHATGAVVYHSISATEMDVLNAHAAASTGVHGAAGTIVGTSDTQTLTNKTISGSANTFSNIAKASITGAPSGAFVGTTDAQTLTNKTIDGEDNTFANIPPDAIVGGQFFTRSVYTSAGTFSYADPGEFYSTFRFIVTGAGGGGGGGSSAANSIGSSGGGAACNDVILDRADLTFPLEFVVPAGGAAGTSGNPGNAGTGGGSATVKNSNGAGSTVVSAAGGGGGGGGGAGAGGSAGAAGTGGSTGTGTGVLRSGGYGDRGASFDSATSAGIQGGGSGFAPMDGGRRSTTVGGAGRLGCGGAGGNGNTGGGPGSGGVGGDGVILVEAW